MKLHSFEIVAKTLTDAKVQYLVAGGLAVNAHGYVRFTADIDLVLALDATNIHSAFSALATIGYRPNVPVTATQFSNPVKRKEWITTKNMQVLNFYSDLHRETSVDIFVYEPFEFGMEYTQALMIELLPGVPTRFVSIPTLIRMKEIAGRLRDLDDIEHLMLIQKSRSNHE